MMTLAKIYLPDFDQEMTNTRRVLERVPTERGRAEIANRG
jgi:hypothetical protein